MGDPVPAERSWLVLVHQLPSQPPGVRVRIWRRLQAIGALPLKGSVYVLPDRAETREDLEWLVREIEAAGAEALLLRSRFVSGVSDEECVSRFRAAAAEEYEALGGELEPLGRRGGKGRRKGVADEDLRRKLPRLRERFGAIERRDFFGADGHMAVAKRLRELEGGGEGGGMKESRGVRSTAAKSLRGKTWTTRAGVHVDRMASAWLVRRFVDPEARFRFVASSRIDPAPGDVRFDTFGGEFTHEGEKCTFEVLVERLRLRDAGLRKLGEIVHDLDLKDDRFGHAETAGIAAAVDGIVASSAEDAERIERAASLFDGLLARFSRGR